MTNKTSQRGSQGRVERVQGIRRSNAAGTMADKRTKRNRDRASQRRNAITESRA